MLACFGFSQSNAISSDFFKLKYQIQQKIINDVLLKKIQAKCDSLDDIDTENNKPISNFYKGIKIDFIEFSAVSEKTDQVGKYANIFEKYDNNQISKDELIRKYKSIKSFSSKKDLNDCWDTKDNILESKCKEKGLHYEYIEDFPSICNKCITDEAYMVEYNRVKEIYEDEE